jgi:hypothetical protein
MWQQSANWQFSSHILRNYVYYIILEVPFYTGSKLIDRIEKKIRKSDEHQQEINIILALRDL